MQQVHVESNCCTANIHAAPETVTLLECAPSSHAPKGGQKGTLPADDVSVHLRLLEHSTPHWWAAAGWERQGRHWFRYCCCSELSSSRDRRHARLLNC